MPRTAALPVLPVVHWTTLRRRLTVPPGSLLRPLRVRRSRPPGSLLRPLRVRRSQGLTLRDSGGGLLDAPPHRHRLTAGHRLALARNELIVRIGPAHGPRSELIVEGGGHLLRWVGIHQAGPRPVQGV